jgi:hypothetical protein
MCIAINLKDIVKSKQSARERTVTEKDGVSAFVIYGIFNDATYSSGCEGESVNRTKMKVKQLELT